MTAGGAIARRIRERRGAGKADQRRGLHAGVFVGYDEGGIWVDHGCRAYFRVEFERQGENRGGESIVRCSSDDGGRHYAEADTRGDVDLIRQHSEAACQEGYSWGFDDRGIWVDHGCRAEFVAQPYERPQHQGGQGGAGRNRSIALRDDGEGIFARWTCGAECNW